MAATTDKARFYLERYVPELQEYAQKGIFSRNEITSITAKRSDFEHILNARGSTPADYARYAAYEMNLDALRKKRCKRMGVKSTTHGGRSAQRTVFFVLERATKKFPGDMGLWMQLINYCKKEKAGKRLAKVFTSVLRLHPRDASLWLLAAKHYAETQGDMTAARGYLQRGLRFCADQEKLWLEYIKLEMVYLAKLAARSRILGLEASANQAKDADEEEEDDDDGMIAIPTITAAEFEPDAGQSADEPEQGMLERIENAPAFTGAIPMVIFDAATKQFARTQSNFVNNAFDVVASFERTPATEKVLRHIIECMQDTPDKFVCQAKRELFGVDLNSAGFPLALQSALVHIRNGLAVLSQEERHILAEKAAILALGYLRHDHPEQEPQDSDVVKVLMVSIKRYIRVWAEGSAKSSSQKTPNGLALFAAEMRRVNRHHEAAIIDSMS